MKRKCLSKTSLFALISLSFLSVLPINAAPVPDSETTHSVNLVMTESQENVLEGKILSRSKKAKVMAMRIDGKIQIIKYNDQTIGIDYARKNENVIVCCTGSGNNILATVVEPGLVSIPDGVKEIDIDDLVELINNGTNNYVLIDARGEQRFNEGHIPNAVSLPLPSLQQNVDILTKIAADKGKELIFYSDGTTCGLCTSAAKIAKELGYTNIKVLLVGVQSWEDEGEMLAVSDERIQDNSSIIIDVREKGLVTSGHIPNTISISVADLGADEMELDFPADRSAPIVFCGTDDQIAQAAAIVGEWGYRQLRQVDGGFNGWQRRGRSVVSGTAPGVEGISWQPRISENQISKQDFKELMTGAHDDAVILDVRTSSETKKGRIKSSLHVSLEDLAEKMIDIPTDKKIIAHCATGSRAEVAAQFLSQYRDDVRFLSAKVRCKGDKCRVR